MASLLSGVASRLGEAIDAGVKAVRVDGTCDVPETMCAGAISITVDANYPCDTRDTAAVEACMQPQAIILAPTKISSCPGTQIRLDGSRSSGGGIKPLIFQWSCHPTRSDNYYTIQPSVREPTPPSPPRASIL